MENTPFKTNGLYVRHILPEFKKVYSPLRKEDSFWHATNFRENLSSYELLWFDKTIDFKTNEIKIKASFDTRTGEIFELVDNYHNNITKFGRYEVKFDDETFEFENGIFRVAGTPNHFDNENPLDTLYVSATDKNDCSYLLHNEYYRKSTFRFIPFAK